MLDKFIKDINKYFRYSVVSAQAQLRSEVANSYLNWIWWILDPMCFMLIYTFIFGYVFKASEPYFPVFIFIGLSIWDFFNRTIKQSVKLVKNNKSIVTKVYMPKFILILTKLWVNAFKMMISFGIVILLMLFYRVPVTLNVLFLVPIMITMMLFTFGCATFLLHFGVYVEDLANVMEIALRFLFYLTGIFYNIESRIPQIGKLLNEINPVAFLITSLRKCMMYESMPNVKLLIIWFFISLLKSVLGIRMIYKNENSYVKVI